MGEGVLEVPRQPGGRRGLISHRVVAARVKGIGAGNEPVSAIKSVPGPEEKVVRSGRGRKGADPPESDCAVGRADIGCRLAVEEPAAFFISGVRFKLIFEFEPNSPAAAERFSAFETETGTGILSAHHLEAVCCSAFRGGMGVAKSGINDTIKCQTGRKGCSRDQKGGTQCGSESAIHESVPVTERSVQAFTASIRNIRTGLNVSSHSR